MRLVSVADARRRRGLHTWYARERTLDLAQLDAVAAKLHLAIAAAHELENSVGVSDNQIGRPIHARARHGRERIGQEQVSCLA